MIVCLAGLFLHKRHSIFFSRIVVVDAFLAGFWTPIGSNRFIDPGFVVANQISVGLSNQPFVAGIGSIQEIGSIPALIAIDIVSSVYSLFVIICCMVVVVFGPAVGNDNALVNRERHKQKQCPNCRLSRHGAMPFLLSGSGSAATFPAIRSSG